MATAQKFNAFVEHMAEKVHNCQTDTLKVLLTNTAPVATNSVKADLTEITGGVYASGGYAVTVTTSAQTSGAYKCIANDVIITATGGTIGPFRYAVLYNDTPTSPADPLIQWWDYGSAITLNDGENIKVAVNQTNGLFRIS